MKFVDVTTVCTYKKGIKNKITSLLMFYLLYLKYLKVVSVTKSVGNKFSKSLMGWERVAECYSVHPSLSAGGGGGGGELPTKFQKRGLTGLQFLEGGCWERGGDFFQGRVCNFSMRSKLKSGIFNEKKSL